MMPERCANIVTWMHEEAREIEAKLSHLAGPLTQQAMRRLTRSGARIPGESARFSATLCARSDRSVAYLNHLGSPGRITSRGSLMSCFERMRSSIGSGIYSG